MNEETRKLLDEKVTDPWSFVIETSQRYKIEFEKTSKIGQPPKIDDIIKIILEEKDTFEKKNSEK